jgi:drug/metabolite transporter (DMT)-like permease
VLPLEADTVVDTPADTWHGVGFLIASAVLFGVMAVGVRVAARELPTIQIAWLRFMGSLVVLLAITRGRHLRPRPGNLSRVLLRGLLGCAAIVCYFVAIQEIGAGLATLLQCMYPIPTAVIGVMLLDERASWRLAAAIVLNVAGVVLVVGPGATFAEAGPRGVVIALTGALLAGAAVATARHLRKSENASLITIYFMAVGALVTAPAMLGGLPVLSSEGRWALVGVVLTSAAGQWLLHHGLGSTPASVGSLASAMGVITAVGLETLVLGGHLEIPSLGGSLLMIVAIGLAAPGARRMPAPVPSLVGS